MKNENLVIKELSHEDCVYIFGGEAVIVGWEKINSIWTAIYQNI